VVAAQKFDERKARSEGVPGSLFASRFSFGWNIILAEIGASAIALIYAIRTRERNS